MRCCQFAHDGYNPNFIHNDTLHCGACGQVYRCDNEVPLMNAKLTFCDNDIPLTNQAPNTIGRLGTNKVQLPWALVSRTHCTVYYVAKLFGSGGWFLKDHASLNGTTLNGSKLDPEKPVALYSGDRVGIGGIEYTFVEE